MEDKINISTPDSKFIEDMQEYPRLFRDKKMGLLRGNIKCIYDYVLLLNLACTDIKPFAKNRIEDLKKLEDNLNNSPNGIAVDYNQFLKKKTYRIINQEHYSKYIESLFLYEDIIRDIMKDNNFLVNTKDKKMRMT